MVRVKRLAAGSVVACVVLLSCGTANAEDISGTVVRTLILSENTRLVGDVTCQVTGAPCIAFGAPNIALLLNGFTITGQAEPSTGCQGKQVPTDIGISTNGQNNVGIRGPGVVQRFSADGILFMATVRGWVQGVTTTTNCMSGIRINPTSSAISVESNVSVRNGTTNGTCGGIWIQGSNNSFRWNETSGNGYATGATDFGIGLLSGDNNLVEANTAIGNTNGIVVFPAATNSAIRQNLVVGNPPIQQSNSLPAGGGVDVWNQSAPSNNNTFSGNMCLTAVNAPCPAFSTGAIPRKPGS
jgi:parallel beta-helix repeat protein